MPPASATEGVASTACSPFPGVPASLSLARAMMAARSWKTIRGLTSVTSSAVTKIWHPSLLATARAYRAFDSGSPAV